MVLFLCSVVERFVGYRYPYQGTRRGRSLYVPQYNQCHWCGKKLEHTPSPIYLGVTLDRTLSYSTHTAKVKAKTAARNNVLRKLANSKWGTHPSTIKTTALALCYSTAEYACPVWESSAHAHKVDPVLNNACRAITGCLQPTNVENLYLLAGIAPPAV